ncbi:hypothetical protein A2697_02665 [Candidatus Curtissbacteria bacterium RIFCSPHIGHO2_01_FULL_41_44]|uniref:Bacterial Ig-like domain-containing protein n=1 Tax=Candidatus Curtissbacteria bacterium RIFCSPLOWO2_01_FULL_42_50 TaxID=1797730 RepID=A0A1F5H862_9BACT|nr:MAG: hypothetical protein A2697_02665 [Candidatus Curtissbacteria bacterium RIFCSPHIGHO2_01_FULL_41_44]OGE00353.1 MAG: hypothetical protein A3B54_01430 [Candidatus Curtissbacteria bacterium RIFCSPLOWO2_01_FULL_42_50]OGE03818.1 MAG: hypothetical protein A3G16_05080 [Candidatus Curtissbacteria bacterium RIFCSPLOWO2_12_FULL_41_16]
MGDDSTKTEPTLPQSPLSPPAEEIPTQPDTPPITPEPNTTASGSTPSDEPSGQSAVIATGDTVQAFDRESQTESAPSAPAGELASKIPVDEAPPVATENTQGQGSSKTKVAGVVLAFIILIAAVAGGGYWWWSQRNKAVPEEITTRVERPKASLIIAAPQDQMATTSAQIQIEGKTSPDSMVTAYTESSEETYESDDNGDFSGTLTLDEGPNDITITAFGDNNEETSETRSVVYVREEEL